MRALGSLVLVAALATVAHAKPLTIWTDFEARRASLIAEVEILSITPGRQMGRGWRDFDIRVRITAQPDRIYRGFSQLGREVTLSATRGGWRSCAHQLREWQRLKRQLLLIVDDEQQVRMAGLRTSAGYRLQGFYDFNACWVRCQDTTFGAVNTGRTRIDVTTRSLGKVHRVERQTFWARVARFVGKENPALSADDVDALVGALGAPDQARRVAAHQELVSKGELAIGSIRAAAAKAVDPEGRRRIQTTLRALDPYAIAWDVSKRVKPEWDAWVLAKGMKGLAGDPLRHARKVHDALTSGAPKGERTPR